MKEHIGPAGLCGKPINFHNRCCLVCADELPCLAKLIESREGCIQTFLDDLARAGWRKDPKDKTCNKFGACLFYYCCAHTKPDYTQIPTEDFKEQATDFRRTTHIIVKCNKCSVTVMQRLETLPTSGEINSRA